MIGKILLSIFFSLSVRSSNVQPNPNDYEVAVGANGVNNSHVEMLVERENGIKYEGLDLFANSKYVETSWLYKEARNIDTQNITAKYPIEDWEIGICLNSVEWDHGQPLLFMGYWNKIMKLSYRVGLDRQIITSKISQRLPLRENLFIEPQLSYYNETDKDIKRDFWAAKIILGIKFE